MLNTGIGTSYEEARALKELAKAALNAFIESLVRERFEQVPIEIAFDHAGTHWTLIVCDDDPCPTCGVTRDIHWNGEDDSLLFAFCHLCWELDLKEDGKRIAGASRRLEKAVRDLTPGATMTMTIGGTSYPLGPRRLDAADPTPSDLDEYAERAEASCETGRQLWLARLYWEGRDGVSQDDREAVYWFEKAASSGHTGALQSLAFCHAQGRGVFRNDEKAVELFRQAAERGSAVAMCALADHYNQGLGLPRDPVAAAGWFRLAAHEGNTVAQRSYGLCLLGGTGVPPDRHEALVWLRKAAEAGDEDAVAAVADHDPSGPAPDGAGRQLELPLT